MKMMKFTKSLLCLLLLATSGIAQGPKADQTKAPSKRVVIAYVTSWTSVMPDPTYLTHINYAFGHVNETFDGVRIDNESRLQSLTALKAKFPKLKVLISIGGWGSGRFSEMAGSDVNRKKFAEDCLRVINEFKLDGIDIDWEYPTSNMAKISAAPEDTENYTLMMAEIRKKIGKNKLLTLASVADGKYIDFRAIAPVVDFVNIMTYDMGRPPFHHAGLFRSKYTSGVSIDEGVDAHVAAGMPIHKLVLGLPFYGHGKDGIADFIDYKEIIKLNGYQQQWDEVAQVPFLENDKGEYVCTYENPESIAIKCKYLLSRGMLGAMYWEYAGDTEDGVLRKAVFSGVNK